MPNVDLPILNFLRHGLHSQYSMQIHDTKEEAPTVDLFEDINLVQEEATRMQRFINYVIDNLFIRFALGWLAGELLVFIVSNTSPEAYTEWYYSLNQFEARIYEYLLGVLVAEIYYLFSEQVFNGYTLGKLVTGTRAIREDGGKLRFRDVLIRSLSRAVPFEPLSGFGYPWHDRWSRTIVVSVRK